MTVERVAFNPAGDWPHPRPYWDRVWCEWMERHGMRPGVRGGDEVLIDWLVRDEARYRIYYPTPVWEEVPGRSGDAPLQRPVIAECGCCAAERVAYFQLEARPLPFPELPPGAWIERNPHW